jgi:hypothetical protein
MGWFFGKLGIALFEKKIFLCASSVSEYIVKVWYTLAFIFVSFFFAFLKENILDNFSYVRIT